MAAGDSVLVEPPNIDPDIDDNDAVRVAWVDGTGGSATVAPWEGADR